MHEAAATCTAHNPSVCWWLFNAQMICSSVVYYSSLYIILTSPYTSIVSWQVRNWTPSNGKQWVFHLALPNKQSNTDRQFFHPNYIYQCGILMVINNHYYSTLLNPMSVSFAFCSKDWREAIIDWCINQCNLADWVLQLTAVQSIPLVHLHSLFTLLIQMVVYSSSQPHYLENLTST